MARIRSTIILLLAMMLLPPRSAGAEPSASDLYFVSIGSQTYVKSPKAAPANWEPVPAPANSAERVAALLGQAGAKFGILLTSDQTHAVTKGDMQGAIVALKTRIRQDRSQHPVVVFYFMGHGLGDHFNQTLYMMPGNVPLTFLPKQSATAVLERAGVSNLEVVTSLVMFRLPPALAFEDRFFISDLTPDPADLSDFSRVKGVVDDLTRQDDENRAQGRYPPGRVPPVPFVALFDDCYGGVVQDLVDARAGSPVETPLLALMRKGMDAVRDAMLADLGGAQSDGLVLYAAPPGQDIGHFADPDDPDDAYPVGSLARRLMLAIPKAASPGRMSFRDLRAAIGAPDKSAGTIKPDSWPVNAPPPFSIQSTTDEVLDGATFPRQRGSAAAAGAVERRIGTALVDQP